MLEQAGIEFVIRNQYLSGAMGELPITECWPEIWVADEREFEQAMEIVRIATTELSDQSGPWQCSCGEPNEGQFGSCWKCGGDKDSQVGIRDS
jgi:hypothetical protein